MATPSSGQNISKSEGKEGFRKSIRPQSQYQLDHPPKNHKACHASTWDWIEPNGLVEPHFWEVWNVPLMCLKYNIDSLKTHSKDAIYHRLDKTLKFSTTKMQCAQDDQEDFIRVVMWARRVKGNECTNEFWKGGATSQATREQPTKHQETLKFTNTSNSKIQWTYPN